MLIENGNDVDTDNGDLNPIWNDNDFDNYGIIALIIDNENGDDKWSK